MARKFPAAVHEIETPWIARPSGWINRSAYPTSPVAAGLGWGRQSMHRRLIPRHVVGTAFPPAPGERAGNAATGGAHRGGIWPVFGVRGSNIPPIYALSKSAAMFFVGRLAV